MTFLVTVLSGYAQQRHVQHKPYIDLRPLHFGIVVGTHLQDIEFENVGLQTLVDEEGNVSERLIMTECDKWNPHRPCISVPSTSHSTTC